MSRSQWDIVHQIHVAFHDRMYSLVDMPIRDRVAGTRPCGDNGSFAPWVRSECSEYESGTVIVNAIREDLSPDRRQEFLDCYITPAINSITRVARGNLFTMYRFHKMPDSGVQGDTYEIIDKYLYAKIIFSNQNRSIQIQCCLTKG